MGKLQNLKNSFHQYGAKGMVTRYAFGVIKKLTGVEIKKSIFFVRKIDKPYEEVLEFKRLSFEDFKKAAINDRNPVKWFSDDKMKIIRKRFNENGIIPFGHFEGDLLSCIGWINYNGGKIGKILLSHEDAYFFDDYTIYQFRGKGLQFATIKFRINEAFSQGCRQAWSMVYSFNRPSKKNYLKAGFEPAIKLTTIVNKKGKIKRKYVYLKSKTLEI